MLSICTWHLGFGQFHVRVAIDPVTSVAEVRHATLRIYRNHPDNFSLTVELSRVMFCYLFFMTLVAHLSGVLNTLRYFAMPAAAPNPPRARRAGGP